MIAVIDYGMGNLRSVQKAFDALGHPALISADPDRIRKADRLVLPGVGAFADAIAQLKSTGLDEVVRESVAQGKPVLGVCLGLQLLFEQSEEDGLHAGLGMLPGRVRRFTDAPGLKIPHMGWNSLRIQRPIPLLHGLPDNPYVYFVHSYHAEPAHLGDVAATADYRAPFAAVVARENLVACQFHPEKSQRVGLQIYKNFTRM